MKKIYLLFSLALLVLFFGACSDKTSDEPSPADNKKEEMTNDKNKENEDEDDSKKNVSAKKLHKRNDAGDFDVEIEGDIVYEDGHIVVNGTTNLLPGSKLTLDLSPMEGSIIGGVETVKVNEDGSFNIKQKLPNGYDDPMIYTEIYFRPNNNSSEIESHYKEDGENLSGPFVRLYKDGDHTYKCISIHNEIDLNKPGKKVKIVPPSWNKPKDYGSTNIWMEAEVMEDKDFVYIHGKSNLLEGSSVSGNIEVEGYISWGYNDSVHVNPDGSFTLTITNPRKKMDIKNGYTIEMKFEPTNYNNFPIVLETYGENGEKLEGKLVKNKEQEKYISYVLSVGK